MKLFVNKVKATYTDSIKDKLQESRNFILIYFIAIKKHIHILFILTYALSLIKVLVLQTGSQSNYKCLKNKIYY